jgi:hypothetical protein
MRKRVTIVRKKISTRLNRGEMRSFLKVRKYVRSFCGPVPDAEVLRFLVRNWEEGSSPTAVEDAVSVARVKLVNVAYEIVKSEYGHSYADLLRVAMLTRLKGMG